MSEDELRDLCREAYTVVNRAICDEDSGEGVDTKKLRALLDKLAPALDLPWLKFTPDGAVVRALTKPWGRPP